MPQRAILIRKRRQTSRADSPVMPKWRFSITNSIPWIDALNTCRVAIVKIYRAKRNSERLPIFARGCALYRIISRVSDLILHKLYCTSDLLTFWNSDPNLLEPLGNLKILSASLCHTGMVSRNFVISKWHDLGKAPWNIGTGTNISWPANWRHN